MSLQTLTDMDGPERIGAFESIQFIHFFNGIYSLKTGSRSRPEYLAFLIRRTHLLLPLPKHHEINLQISYCYFVYLAFHEKLKCSDRTRYNCHTNKMTIIGYISQRLLNLLIPKHASYIRAKCTKKNTQDRHKVEKVFEFDDFSNPCCFPKS